MKLAWTTYHHIKQVFGLGFFCEPTKILMDSSLITYDTITFKIFLGPFIINGSLILKEAKRQLQLKGDHRAGE